ncbi:MAG: SusE domain-containing protein [Bacteroidota bacterium]
MKKIVKIISLFTLMLGFTACEIDDNNIIVKPGDSPELVSPEEGTNYVLDPMNPTNPAITVVWNHAKYSVGTEVNYTVEIAQKGTDFANPIVLQETTARQISLTMEQFNQKVLDAGLTPFTAGEVDIRVKGALGTDNVMEVISNEITINVTPFTTELPKLAVAGNHQGWTPSTAPRLAASAFGETDFEGYVWLDGEYKFVAANATGAFEWGNTDYGDDGTFSNVLLETGESNCNNPAGYYLVKANTTALTYSAEPTAWAITGGATPNGWPDPALDHDMTYNPTTKKWEITIALSAGEFKFRANNAWTLNLGADNDGDGSMDYGGPNLVIATAGTYTVTLDLSNPRAYTYNVQ